MCPECPFQIRKILLFSQKSYQNTVIHYSSSSLSQGSFPDCAASFFSCDFTRRSSFLMSSAAGKFFRLNAALPKHISYRSIILHMFSGNRGFTLKVLLLDIIVCHFRCKVLCGNRECRQEISQRAIIFYPKSFLHFLCRVTTKQRTIPLRANAAKPSVIHAALINVLRKPFFGFPQPASGFCAFNKRNTFFNQFLLSSLNGKVALRKCNFFFFGSPFWAIK